MVVLSLAVLEEYVRQNFFYMKLSVLQTPRAAAFQACNYPGAGIVPPRCRAGMEGTGAGSPTSSGLPRARPICKADIAARLQPMHIAMRGEVCGGGVVFKGSC